MSTVLSRTCYLLCPDCEGLVSNAFNDKVYELKRPNKDEMLEKGSGA